MDDTLLKCEYANRDYADYEALWQSYGRPQSLLLWRPRLPLLNNASLPKPVRRLLQSGEYPS
jgi:hypothetical protein